MTTDDSVRPAWSSKRPQARTRSPQSKMTRSILTTTLLPVAEGAPPAAYGLQKGLCRATEYFAIQAQPDDGRTRIGLTGRLSFTALVEDFVAISGDYVQRQIDMFPGVGITKMAFGRRSTPMLKSRSATRRSRCFDWHTASWRAAYSQLTNGAPLVHNARDRIRISVPVH